METNPQLKLLPRAASTKPVLKEPAGTFPLCQSKTRREVRIRSLHHEPATQNRLEQMGIVPGEYIEVVANDHKGRVALQVGARTIILGRRITYKTTVIYPQQRCES